MKNTVKYWRVLAALSAIFFTACFGFDERPENTGHDFVPVKDITGIPTGGLPYVGISLSATVLPENATNKKINWSIKSGAGASLRENVLTVDSASDVTVTVNAVIKDGLGTGADYTQDFTLFISMTEIYPVREITGIPWALPIGDKTFTLKGSVVPSNAINTTITWSVKNQGGTGTVINGNVLTATAPGTVTITGTVANGLFDRDYTEDFELFISRPFIAVGYSGASDQGGDTRYYVRGEPTQLRLPAQINGQNIERGDARGIVFANDKYYIAGTSTAGYNARVYLYFWTLDRDKTQTRIDLTDGLYRNSSGIENYTRFISIAADGGDVYIFAKVETNYFLWKINDANPNGERIPLQVPAGQSLIGVANSIAVKDGEVYIPFNTGNNFSSWYWDKDGQPQRINQLDNTDIHCTAFVNGVLYMAGVIDNSIGNAENRCFWRWGDAAPTLLPNPTEYGFSNRMGVISSIVDQNGVPAIYTDSEVYDYASSATYKFFWVAQEITYLPTMFVAGKVVFSDGYAFAPIASFGGYERTAYMILREPFPCRTTMGMNVSAIAVWQWD